MEDTAWRLQDAKAQFSALVDAALNGQAQHVTRRGKAAVVIVSEAEYAQLRQGSRAAAPGFIEHLLAMPRGGKAAVTGRSGPKLRDLEFE